MKYKYLLFDLDGTLVDTFIGVMRSAQYALREYGINKEIHELKHFFGPPLRVSFEKYGLNEAQIIDAIAKYRERYDKFGASESKLFEEIPEILVKLKNAGYSLGVATSKYEEYSKFMLENFGIGKYFDYITGSNLDESISKKHEVIEESLRRFNITEKREDVLMIGDLRFDIEGAKLAKIDSLGIYTGTAQENEHENAGATYVAYSFKELEKILLKDLY